MAPFVSLSGLSCSGVLAAGVVENAEASSEVLFLARAFTQRRVLLDWSPIQELVLARERENTGSVVFPLSGAGVKVRSQLMPPSACEIPVYRRTLADARGSIGDYRVWQRAAFADPHLAQRFAIINAAFQQVLVFGLLLDSS